MNLKLKSLQFFILVGFFVGCVSIPKNNNVHIPTNQITKQVPTNQVRSTPKHSPLQAIEDVNIKPLYKPVSLPTVQLKKPEKFNLIIKRKRKNPIQEIRHSVEQATQQPDSENSINATTIYQYVQSNVFEVYCSPIRITTIMLQENEILSTPPAIGDSVRWKIAESHTGNGAKKRVILWVKPIYKDISTNIIITTNRRIYFLDAKSSTDVFQPSIAWTYPEENFTEFKEEIEEESNIEEGSEFYVNLKEMNHRYKIKGKTKWTPIKVFDDGKKTYIKFPSDIEQYELPPLFTTSDDSKEGQLVNYRYINGYYIVDRLFESAFLKMGNKKSQFVYINRIKQ